MPSYCLYALLYKEQIDYIKQLIEEFKKEFENTNSIIYCPNEDPHITIVYGPEMKDSDKELTTYNKEEIEKLYPKFIDEYKEQDFYNERTEGLSYRGISHFDRPSENKYILKIDFESPLLTSMREYIYKSTPEFEKIRSNEKEKIKNVKYDESWDNNPKNWCHITIAVVDRNKCNLLEMEQFIRFKMNDFPSSLKITSIALISAVNDIVIPLWNIKN